MRLFGQPLLLALIAWSKFVERALSVDAVVWVLFALHLVQVHGPGKEALSDLVVMLDEARLLFETEPNAWVRTLREQV